MPTYDGTRFSPPAPCAIVQIRNPSNRSAIGQVLMLLDTGADITVIPGNSIEPLGMQPDPEKAYEIVGYAGGTSIAQVVHAELVFSGLTFKGQFLIGDSEVGILGRNVLNQLRIVLDGPNQIWDAAG